MHQDELLLVQETKSAVSRGAHRGADKTAIFGSIEDVGTGPTYSKMQASQKDDSRLQPMPLKELSLMHFITKLAIIASSWLVFTKPHRILLWISRDFVAMVLSWMLFTDKFEMAFVRGKL